VSLADQIINHGPYVAYQVVPNAVMRWIESDQLNALRDELLELRQLRTLLVELTDTDPCEHFDHHGQCQTHFTGTIDGRCAQAVAQELVRRATQHAEGCR
jgi:hypothetical protein